MTLFRSAALIGARDTQTRSTKLMAKHHALARRLIDRQDDYLRFTVDPRVSFDDNAAEHEIRMIKLRQKVSGCLRTLTGPDLISHNPGDLTSYRSGSLPGARCSHWLQR